MFLISFTELFANIIFYHLVRESFTVLLICYQKSRLLGSWRRSQKRWRVAAKVLKCLESERHRRPTVSHNKRIQWLQVRPIAIDIREVCLRESVILKGIDQFEEMVSISREHLVMPQITRWWLTDIYTGKSSYLEFQSYQTVTIWILPRLLL